LLTVIGRLPFSATRLIWLPWAMAMDVVIAWLSVMYFCAASCHAP
jgi:hypothetical protein